MQGLLLWWERRCTASRGLRFVDLNLRGIGQVMFQDNPLSGLLFFIAMGWGSYVAGTPQVAIGGVVAIVAAKLAALWLRVEAASLGAGLYGFNAYLIGLALPTFLAPSPLLWCYVVLGGVVSVPATIGIANVCRSWGVATLTAPFVLVTWLLLLATHAFGAIEGTGLPMSDVIKPIDAAAANPLEFKGFVEGVVKSIGQVFLSESILAALLLLAGLAVNSIPAAACALGGAVVAVITAHVLGAESNLISGGLLGFSPVLTAIALGAVFYKPCAKVALYALVATIFTVVAQSAMNALFTPFGIPALTAPFVLVTWLFLLPRQTFEPAQAS
jgi:urea transporter